MKLEERRSKKPSKFLDRWAGAAHYMFIPLVEVVWNQDTQGTPMFQVCHKLKNLKVELKILNTKVFSDLSRRLDVLRAKLIRCQGDLDKNPQHVTQS